MIKNVQGFNKQIRYNNWYRGARGRTKKRFAIARKQNLRTKKGRRVNQKIITQQTKQEARANRRGFIAGLNAGKKQRRKK